MPAMSAGQAVVEALRLEGVKYIFGVVGSCYVEVLDALYGRTDIQFLGVRHEQVAAHMADAYARAGGLPGVCMATNGPGATNLLTGVASAYVNHAPMIVITGAPMISQMLRDSFQELDQLTLFRPVTKAQIQIQRGDRVPELVRHAFRVAMAGKKGPVLVDLPRDMLNETAEMAFIPPERYRWAQRDAGDSALVQRAAEVLSQAAAPVVIAGGGVTWSGAQAEVLAAAERLTAAVVTSYGRNDAVPHDHPLVIGAFGRAGSAEAAEAVRGADVVLAVGTRLAHFTTFFDYRFIPQQAKIIQIEVDEKELGRHYPLEVGILGDAKAVLGGFCKGSPVNHVTRRACRRSNGCANNASSAWPRPVRRTPYRSNPSGCIGSSVPCCRATRSSRSMRALPPLTPTISSIFTSRRRSSPPGISGVSVRGSRRPWAPNSPTPTGPSSVSAATAAFS